MHNAFRFVKRTPEKNTSCCPALGGDNKIITPPERRMLFNECGRENKYIWH